jgi:hypothetical protein
MNRISKGITLFIMVFFTQLGHAQSNLVVEQIQVYSTLNPTGLYWQLPSNTTPLLEALDHGIFRELQLQRNPEFPTIQRALTRESQMGKINVNWANSANIPFHAYLELYEVPPNFAYNNNLVDLPKSKKDSVHSFWLIGCTILNQKQAPVFQKTIVLGIIPIEAYGMGYVTNSTASTPNNMYQAIAKCIALFSAKADELDYLEAKLPVAYTTDNYWMPYLHNQVRTLLDTSKGFIGYSTNGAAHLLRVPPAILNKIDLKDKSLNNPYASIIPIIKKTRSGTGVNEYYEVIQPLRDVKKDIDYAIKGYIEFKNNASFFDQTQPNAIEFLADSLHYIFQEKEIIGKFVVKENEIEKGKYFNPNEIYNGLDSTKKYTVFSGKSFNKQPIIHSRVVSGTLKNHSFIIQFNFDSNIKTILLDNQIIMIMEGENKPSRMVITPTPHDTEMNDLLLLMASSEIFQYPS